MYFRTKSINGTPLVQLVQSYRNAEGLPRQRVIASLGDAKLPEAEKPSLARVVKRHLQGHRNLFERDLSEEAASWVARLVQLAGSSKSATPVTSTSLDGVLLDEIQTSNVVQLGPQLVARQAWEELRFTPMLKGLGLNASQIAVAFRDTHGGFHRDKMWRKGVFRQIRRGAFRYIHGCSVAKAAPRLEAPGRIGVSGADSRQIPPVKPVAC